MRGLGFPRGVFFLHWWCGEIHGGRPESVVDGAEDCFENLSRTRSGVLAANRIVTCRLPVVHAINLRVISGLDTKEHCNNYNWI